MNIQIKPMRDSFRCPERTGGAEKSCWYDLSASRIQVGRIEGTQFVPHLECSIRAKDKPLKGHYAINSSKFEEEIGELMWYVEGDVVKIDFGFALGMLDGKEAVINPRSSTFRKLGLILTNSQGVIDTAYRGNDDEWSSFWYATRDGAVAVGDRVAQFRIQDAQPEYSFEVVSNLNSESRGGFGTTGR